MSAVYGTEPTPTGRIMVETTHGPLDIQLYCRECPETTRVFVQLCMDGYYDHMIFHRIIPKFLISTGAVRRRQKQQQQATIEVDESSAVYAKKLKEYRDTIRTQYALDRRKYELHSRLRFRHRGQVAMTLGVNGGSSSRPGHDGEPENDEDDVEIQPQFFITLDEASHLDGQHVVFGTVVGPTIFNAIRIGSVDVDETTHQPTEWEDAPRIESIRIVENPFHTSLVPTVASKVPWKMPPTALLRNNQKKKRAGKRDLNVLSFGMEMEEEANNDDDAVDAKKGMLHPGIQSRYDAQPSQQIQLHDDAGQMSSRTTRNSSHVINGKGGGDNDHRGATATSLPRSEERLIATSTTGHREEETDIADDETDKNVPLGARVAAADVNATDPLRYLSTAPPLATTAGVIGSEKVDASLSTNQQATNRVRSIPANEGTNATTTTTTSTTATTTTAIEQNGSRVASMVEARRAMYMRHGRKDKRQRDEDTMERLLAFQNKIRKSVVDQREVDAHGEVDRTNDNSLAMRMARREERKDDCTSDHDDHTGGGQHYHGQVLDTEQDDSGKGQEWLRTKFKCRRHIDHRANEEGAQAMVTLGGDGRTMDEYDVIDERNRGASSHREQHKPQERHKKSQRHDQRDLHRHRH